MTIEEFENTFFPEGSANEENLDFICEIDKLNYDGCIQQMYDHTIMKHRTGLYIEFEGFVEEIEEYLKNAHPITG